MYQTGLIVKSLVFLAILPMLPVPSCCSNLFLEKGPFPFISSLDSVYFSSICNNMAFTRWWRYLVILWQYADNWTSWIDKYINISCNVYDWLDGWGAQYFNMSIFHAMYNCIWLVGWMDGWMGSSRGELEQVKLIMSCRYIGKASFTHLCIMIYDNYTQQICNAS